MKEGKAFILRRKSYLQYDGSMDIRKNDLLFDIYGELIYTMVVSRDNFKFHELVERLIYIGGSEFYSYLKEQNIKSFDYIE